MDDTLRRSSHTRNTLPHPKSAWRAAAFSFFLTVAVGSVSPAHAATYTVVNPSDTGDGSFRNAITDANSVASPGLDTIVFNIPAESCSAAGVCSIVLATQLPALDDPVIIDGTTQPRGGTAPANVCATATDPSYMRVQITAPPATNVLAITSSTSSTIRGLSLAGQYAISLRSDAAHRIECNHLGVNAEGTSFLDTGAGVLLEQAATGAIIGTNGDGVGDIGERNVFGGGMGVNVNANSDNVIAGNYFGLGADGISRVGISTGIYMRQSSYRNLIGTNGDGLSDEIERNVIGYADTGLWLFTWLGAGDGNQVVGNWIGLDTAGNPASNTTGIALERSGRLDGSGAYHIQGNRIESNGTGILTDNEVTLMAASDENCLVDNLVGFDHSGDQVLPFEDNWWGTSNGPSGIGAGSGDPVQENSTGTLDYDPWLTRQGAACVPEPSGALLQGAALLALSGLAARLRQS